MPAGRPPKFETPEELDAKIEEYFNQDNLKPTITGMVLHLGFCSRDAFYKYEKKEEFRYAIKNAHCRIEQKYEENLSDNNVAGSIFALKNLGWKDKTEQQVTLHTEQPLFKPLEE